MADVPAAKRVRRAIGTVCDACGVNFASSYAFDKHRTCPYLIGTPCFVLDDGSTRNKLSVHRTSDDVHRHAAKAEGCSTKTRYNDVMFQNAYVAYAAYITKNYLASNSRSGSNTTLPGVRGDSLCDLLKLLYLDLQA